MNRRWAIVALLMVTAGCDNGQAWFPLHDGQSWDYRIRTPHYQYVETIAVKGQTAVGDSVGYVLDSPLGEARVAWDGGMLVAGMLGHTHFVPPIPLFDSMSANSKRSWKGIAIVAGKTMKGTGEFSQSEDDRRIAGDRTITRKSVFQLTVDKHSIEWTGWFAKGVGLIQQEQRTDGMLAVSLEMIRGS